MTMTALTNYTNFRAVRFEFLVKILFINKSYANSAAN